MSSLQSKSTIERLYDYVYQAHRDCTEEECPYCEALTDFENQKEYAENCHSSLVLYVP